MDHNSRNLTLKLHISIIPYPERRKTQEFSTLTLLYNNVCFNNALSDIRATLGKSEFDDNPPLRKVRLLRNLKLEMMLDWLANFFDILVIVTTIRRSVDCALDLKFSCMIVLEDMDAYHDEGMSDVIFGEPFLREVRIKARWFDGMITVYNGNESVTYKMARSHLRFQQHTNEQCNKIPPLLKVSEEDMINGISHSYQKLKGFYKGVLNLDQFY
ncbi:hypothetical protein Tco_1347095 [Tanacetum coccineum]